MRVSRITHLAAVVEEFALESAAQQLVDRFLIGYPRGATFRRRPAAKVTLCGPGIADDDALLERRRRDHALATSGDLKATVAAADAVLVIPRGAGEHAAGDLLTRVVATASAETPVFAYGVLGRDAALARRIVQLATSRRVSLSSGGHLATTHRLPPVGLETPATLSRGLVVVVGKQGEATWLGVDTLLSLVDGRAAGNGQALAGEAGVSSVTAYRGDDVWPAMQPHEWFEQLLAAAISRSDSPQGDALGDGRTQDLMRLGLVRRLAREPVCYLIKHTDGLVSAVLVLNGVIADCNFALRKRDGSIVSAQLYRPPSPNSHHWSWLAERIDDFLSTGVAPWPLERGILAAGLLHALETAVQQPGTELATPQLAIAYAAKR